eukprot:scaffold26125_cov50-Prasinocladus_malaysianus.AAC.2
MAFVAEIIIEGLTVLPRHFRQVIDRWQSWAIMLGDNHCPVYVDKHGEHNDHPAEETNFVMASSRPKG